MGNDQLFRKRKERKKASLARREESRAAYARVLIVCEGSKTEPTYFRELINDFRLSTANVVIDRTTGSSPTTVVERARKAFEEEKEKGDPYDRVYCVFDKDQHGRSYEEALDQISQLESAKGFVAIPSIPCFEYWLLLHFVYTRKSFYGSSKSPGDLVIKALQQHYPGYTKNISGVFAFLQSRLDMAKHNARSALCEAGSSGSDDPSTHVHLLVEFLERLTKQDSPASG